MQVTNQIVHSNRFYPLPNGLAQVRYVGLKYPESQWAGLVDQLAEHVTRVTEIGHITLEAEGRGQLFDIERQLLTMARLHGAHIVLIDYSKSFQIKQSNSNGSNNGVHIYGRCQRFEL